MEEVTISSVAAGDQLASPIVRFSRHDTVKGSGWIGYGLSIAMVFIVK